MVCGRRRQYTLSRDTSMNPLFSTHKLRVHWLLLPAFTVGCGTALTDSETAPPAAGAVRVELTPSVVNFSNPGESVTLQATLFDSEGNPTSGSRGYSWQVSDGGVANLGLWTRYETRVRLTAVRVGETEVTVIVFAASGPNFFDTAPVNVDGPDLGSRRYTMRFENDFLDLDGDTVISCAQACSFPDGTDLKIAFNAAAAVHSRVVQNQAANIEIAYIDGAVFADVTVEDARAATFTTSLVDAPFDSSRVILIRTDQGVMFKLGNPVEAELVVDGVTFDAAPLI